MSIFKKVFKSKRHYAPAQEPGAFSIGSPTDVQRRVHVGMNPITGQIEIENLPEAWQQWISSSNLT